MTARLRKGAAMPIVLNVNGEDRVTPRGPLTPLIDILRDELFLTGAKAVCREGICGACTVMMDGKPVMSCLVPAGIAVGREIRTAEALSGEGEPSPLQRAMLDHDGPYLLEIMLERDVP